MPTLYQSPARNKKSVKTIQPSGNGSSSALGPLTTFAVNPSGVRFETQAAEESVILFVRQHFIVNLPWLVLGGFMLLVPPVLFPFILSLLKLPISLPVGYIIIGTLFWYVATFGFLLGSFMRWFFNIYIVTNERVVDIDFKYFLYKEISEAAHNKIQDLTYRTGGIFATLFRYGTVYVETAGEVPNIEFDGVPNPEKVVECISGLCKKTKNAV